ncbi:MAG: serine/threonine-protein kinase [Labilithrix sp.]
MPGPGIKLEAGHVLDERYLLESVIGEGGMGTVFSARHLELGDIVAVKVLQSANAVATLDAEHLERFLREARLCAKIKNEHVVRVIDVARGKNGLPPYIVMELLDGIDLGELVHSLGPIPIPEAVDYVLQACEALAEAHALGIVHRDLKSSNLHVSKRADGSPLVKVLDFGISKAHDESGADQNLTATSAVFGSPAYMSPEQIRSSKHVDARTDVWALDVVLYELLTNQLPFVGDSAAAMLASISADPYVPVRKYVPTAPEGLERAIHAAFVKDREKRTQTVSAFADSIAPFGGPTAAAAVAAIHRAAQRSSTRSALGGVAALPLAPAAAAAAPPGRAPVSDTMRATPAFSNAPDEADTEPLPRVPDEPATVPAAAPAPAPSARAEEVGRTDREMVVPMHTTSSSSILAIGGALAAVALGVGVLVLVLYVKSRSHERVEFPTAPVVVTVSVTTGVAPPPSLPPEPSPPPAAAAVSLEPPPSTAPRKPPRGTPHPTHAPSAKPNHGIPDTSQRE